MSAVQESTEHAGVRQFVKMVAAIDACRKPNFDVDQDRAMRFVHDAMSRPRTLEARRGFERALAMYISMIVEGSIPDPLLEQDVFER